MMRFTTIFFDVGGTLIHPDMSRLIAPLLAHVQPAPERLAAAERAAKCAQLRNGQGWRAEETGGLGSHSGPINKGYWQVYFETLLAETGVGPELLPELTNRAGNSDYWSKVDPVAAPVLDKLRKDFRLAVISNADGRIDRVLDRAGLGGFFETLVDSGLQGCEKPDPRIFRAAMSSMGAKPEESLYVGDVYAVDYCGASNAGMSALLLDSSNVYRDWRVPRIACLSELPNWITQAQLTLESRVAPV